MVSFPESFEIAVNCSPPFSVQQLLVGDSETALMWSAFDAPQFDQDIPLNPVVANLSRPVDPSAERSDELREATCILLGIVILQAKITLSSQMLYS